MATNEHLPDKVEHNQFRADLLDRLSFEVVTLPPLRARKGDVGVLADHFGRRMAAEMGREWDGFAPEALDAMLDYQWPGNVRELRNVVERAVYRWERGGAIGEVEFDPFKSPHRPGSAPRPEPLVEFVAQEPAGDDDPEPADFKSRVSRFERELLTKALAANRFNQRQTAEAIGLSYDQLRHALRRHDLLPG
jgi:psp operon transcriptional activator